MRDLCDERPLDERLRDERLLDERLLNKYIGQFGDSWLAKLTQTKEEATGNMPRFAKLGIFHEALNH
jgi:hypothetical protein